MKVYDIAKNASSSTEYWKLKDGDILKGYFESDEFEAKSDNFEGKVTMRYSCKFTGRIGLSEQQTKVYKCSEMQVKQLTEACVMNDSDFLNSIFAIKRSGEERIPAGTFR